VRISANAVTLTRIVLLPIPAAILIRGDPFLIRAALIFAVALGATDALDGYLARKHGPTVLGALLDPVADKLFIAAFLLPITAMGHSPSWVVAAIFFRELLITALRSSMELRERSLKTSQLGKLKTVVQMGGLAIYVFLMFTPQPWPLWLNLGGLAGLLVTALVYLLRRKKLPFWLLASIPLWLLLIGLMFVWSSPLLVSYWLFTGIAVVTWVSGVDYLFGAWRVFRQTGIRRADLAKIFWAACVSAVLPLVYWYPGALVPIMIVLGAHLALGGIDNIVTAQTHTPMRAGFIPTALVTLLASAVAALEIPRPERALFVTLAAIVAGVVGVMAALVAFLRHKEFFFPPPSGKADKAKEPADG
jgi:CDP-diacylglycerol--glycerol-3-phosphate 3-phosphatidyltransferase